jgi:hypothetical protein
MARVMEVAGDVAIAGNFSATSMTIPSGTVTNANVSASAAIDATKIVQQYMPTYQQLPSTAVVAETKDVHIARGAGTIVGLEAAITGTIATGADRTVTVDLHKGNAGAAFATVLSATIVFDNTDALRTLAQATLSTTTYADGDIFRVVVTVAGAAGNQALGLVATLALRETA